MSDRGIWTRLGAGSWDGLDGVYWGWSFDGYWDVHFVAHGTLLDGSEVVSELHPTLADARQWVREVRYLDRFVAAWTGDKR